MGYNLGKNQEKIFSPNSEFVSRTPNLFPELRINFPNSELISRTPNKFPELQICFPNSEFVSRTPNLFPRKTNSEFGEKNFSTKIFFSSKSGRKWGANRL